MMMERRKAIYPLIGFPIWYGEGRDPSALMSSIRRAHFDYVEVSLDYPWPFKDVSRLDEIIGEAKRKGLKVALHAPWRDVKLSSPIEGIRKESLEFFKSALMEVRGHFEYVVLHLTTDQTVERSEIVRREALEAAIDSLRTLIGLSRELGQKLAIENVRESVSQIASLASTFPDLPLCLDVGHLISSVTRMRGDPREALSEWAERLAGRTLVVHLSGVRKMGKYVVDHLWVSIRSPLARFAVEIIKRLKPGYVLLEVFQNSKGEDVDPSELKGVVRHLKTRLGGI